MKVLITGATGFIGSRLSAKCRAEGINVHYLTTRKEKIENESDYKGFYWNPDKNDIDLEAFEGVTTIVHLAGANIAKRWTKSYKRVIIKSRVQTANLLFTALKGCEHNVTHFISASGIGIYPPSETALYTEESDAVGQNFLAEVVVAWEEAASRFRELGMDVAILRTGMVLAKDEGAFPKIIKPIKMGVGAPLGDGQQWQSWIHIEDLVEMYFFIIKEELEGVYNGVATTPVTNTKLTKLIAKKVDAALWMPNIPKFLLKLMLGEMAGLVTEGQLVSSSKIEQTGYMFKYSNIDAATTNLLS
ncbi:TIGR01777 family oxidoreductase [Ulvibacter antarcticus]|uniref:TIGR01777 family protein n=1 Tax=Ulvibacter antarcticus TaxID=442714 RepID=A0A3L9YC02_9FLAO|nr:TIGR01777 family oxidoreductase [Ulvibacter antarcticus]RMA57904.1 hypothetical protein BXY75_2711 [Ulvibacter antarcticus]